MVNQTFAKTTRGWYVVAAALLGLVGCLPEAATGSSGPGAGSGAAGDGPAQGGPSGSSGQASLPAGMTGGQAGAPGSAGAVSGSAGDGGGGASPSAGSAGSGAGGQPTGIALTDEQVWPSGVNGPMTWPPELDNPWYSANKNNSVGGYPEGGPPPPLDLLAERIKCKSGAKVRPTAYASAPWEQSRWHPPEYAFDEYSVSRWSSNGAADNWVSADLGSTKTVSQVFLIWEVAYGKDYDLQFSDDNANWSTAKEVRNGNGQADVIELVGTGRYIRMMGVATGTPAYGYSLYEFTICAQ